MSFTPSIRFTTTMLSRAMGSPPALRAVQTLPPTVTAPAAAMLSMSSVTSAVLPMTMSAFVGCFTVSTYLRTSGRVSSSEAMEIMKNHTNCSQMAALKKEETRAASAPTPNQMQVSPAVNASTTAKMMTSAIQNMDMFWAISSSMRHLRHAPAGAVLATDILYQKAAAGNSDYATAGRRILNFRQISVMGLYFCALGI